MGIRVVQRALAPPSPRQFNLSGPSVFSTKDRSKRKTPFSCKFGQEFKSPVQDDRRTSVFQQQATIEENEPTLLGQSSPSDENHKPNSVNGDHEQDNIVQEQNRHNQCEIHVNGEMVEDKQCLNEQIERVPSDHEVKLRFIYLVNRAESI